MYKIVEAYEKDGEQWLTVQKHESQFRVKKYQLMGIDQGLKGLDFHITPDKKQCMNIFSQDSRPY